MGFTPQVLPEFFHPPSFHLFHQTLMLASTVQHQYALDRLAMHGMLKIPCAQALTHVNLMGLSKGLGTLFACFETHVMEF
jgi:hypothetical protein